MNFSSEHKSSGEKGIKQAGEDRVLVTGGAGYIGSHTCKLLRQKGLTPVVIDNLVYGHKEFVKWGPFIQGDICDEGLLDEVFATYAPSAVIHFAAFAYVGESVTDPAKYYTNNVAGTLTILDAMRKYNCERIVFSSTCATYGVPETLPIVEATEQNPINPYGQSKLMVETILQDYERAYGLKSCSLRYFNAAGADRDAEVGERHTPETHLIPLVIDAARGQRESITIYGSDYGTEDGTAVRDYVHVTDLAQAHILALDYLGSKGCSNQFNLGTGKGCSVRQVIDAVERISGKTVPVTAGERRAGDPPILIADASKAMKELGWKPVMSDLDTIIRTAWNWHNSR